MNSIKWALSELSHRFNVKSLDAALLIDRPSNIMDELSSRVHELIIIGSGPAGHTAAIYSARAQLKPLMFEGFMAAGVAAGGQLTTTTDVENFPGFPSGISGPKMMDLFRAQAQRFDTRIITETITKVDLSSHPFQLWREGQEDKEGLRAKAVIIATGATARKLAMPGADDYWQKGISACAVCDGALPMFRNKELAVVGGGDSAAEEATFLTKYASKVYLIHRRDALRSSQIMQKRIFENPRIEILWDSRVVEAGGDGKVITSIKIKNDKKDTLYGLPVSGLFFAIGHTPNTQAFQGHLDLDKDGYIQVQSGTTLTSVAGVFAAGDVQDKKYRQAITAAGSGCMAALDAEHWLRDNKS